jgi:hypothetical protein
MPRPQERSTGGRALITSSSSTGASSPCVPVSSPEGSEPEGEYLPATYVSRDLEGLADVTVAGPSSRRQSSSEPERASQRLP